jgi:heme exporter protein D
MLPVETSTTRENVKMGNLDPMIWAVVAWTLLFTIPALIQRYRKRRRFHRAAERDALNRERMMVVYDDVGYVSEGTWERLKDR